MMTSELKRQLFWTGILATIGAAIVGIGEFTFQYSPRGGYEGEDYLFFLDVSRWRLTFGHFLGVLVAPVYFIGYWHVAQMLRPAGRMIAAGVFGLGVYSFAIGNVWLGGRVNLALIVQAQAQAPADQQQILQQLLHDLSAHNEPFINIVRLAILVVSILIAWGIWRGTSHYPRWMLLFLPIVWLALIFISYIAVPSIGLLLLPAAMNLAHVVFFAMSTWTVMHLQASAP